MGPVGFPCFHRLSGLPDNFAGLLDRFAPLPDSGSGNPDGRLWRRGGLLGHEAGSAPGRLPNHAGKQGGSSALSGRTKRSGANRSAILLLRLALAASTRRQPLTPFRSVIV